MYFLTFFLNCNFYQLMCSLFFFKILNAKVFLKFSFSVHLFSLKADYVYCSLSHLKLVKLLKSANAQASVIYCSPQEHCTIRNKLQSAVFFLCWSFSIPVWCVILRTYLLRNTRCEITLQVGKHSSVSETGLSALQTALWKSYQETNNGGWGWICVSAAVKGCVIPEGKVNSVTKVLWEFCCQYCSGNWLNLCEGLLTSESNSKLYLVTRLFSDYKKGQTWLPNLHHWNCIVSDKNNTFVNNPVWGHRTERRKCCWWF